jgi:hypothetical protein
MMGPWKVVNHGKTMEKQWKTMVKSHKIAPDSPTYESK